MWPLAANAQQLERMRRIGILTGVADEDALTKARFGAFLQELQNLGWTEGRNIRIDTRAGAGNPATIRKYAAELVSLAPEVIVAAGVLRPWRHYLRRPAPYRSYLRTSSTRWVPGLSRSCRGPAATQPAS
jgi:hypothetical protein